MKKEELINAFNTDDLYKVLKVSQKANDITIKKAYKKLALQLHPDRNAHDKENFTKKFQLLNEAYEILSTKKKRENYDKNGIIDDDFCEKSLDEWEDFFRTITEEEILSFKKQYKHSEEEKSDIKDSYLKNKGNMDKIMTDIMLVAYDEEDRIRLIIDELIKSGEVKSYKAYSKESISKRKKREEEGRKEEEEAKEWAAKSGINEPIDGIEDLRKALTVKRKEKHSSFIEQLEAKYCQPPSKKKKRK